MLAASEAALFKCLIDCIYFNYTHAAKNLFSIVLELLKTFIAFIIVVSSNNFTIGKNLLNLN